MRPDRLCDLMKQGFMRGPKQRPAAKERPIIACTDCLGWHREGKHTAPPEVRKANREKAARIERRREMSAIAVTLDGEPAKIAGALCDFATVARLDGNGSGQWSWDAVERILAKGGAFRL